MRGFQLFQGHQPESQEAYRAGRRDSSFWQQCSADLFGRKNRQGLPFETL